MKTLFLVSCLVLSFSIAHSQTITELDEVRIGFAPLNVKVQQDGNTFTYVIENVDTSEFIQNPIGFMKANFDIKNYIAHVEDEDYSSYIVKFNSNKGNLTASYNDEGELIKTSQNFNDILLPYELRCELYKTHKGWTMIKNKYKATTKGEILDKEIYKVTMGNGNKRQTIKLDRTNVGLAVALE